SGRERRHRATCQGRSAACAHFAGGVGGLSPFRDSESQRYGSNRYLISIVRHRLAPSGRVAWRDGQNENGQRERISQISATERLSRPVWPARLPPLWHLLSSNGQAILYRRK